MSKQKATAAAEPAPGADNNKRLAFLESRVEPLTAAVAGITQRFAPDMELAPIDGAEDLVDCNIRLLAQVATYETPCDKRIAAFEASVSSLAIALSGVGVDVGDTDPIQLAISFIEGKEEDANHNATDGEIAAIARADAAAKRVAELELENKELEHDLEEMTELRNKAVNELVAAKEGAPTPPALEDEPEAPPEPIVRERPELARDVGPTYGSLSAAEISAAIAEGRSFELVFSNGEHEILAFEPVQVPYSDLQAVEGKHMIVPAINLRGPEGEEEIHGAGLLLEGVQVGYCALERPLVMRRGDDRSFNRVLIFG